MEDTISNVATAFLFILFGWFVFPLTYVLFTGDFPGASVFYGLQEDHEFVGMIFDVRQFFTK